MLFSGANYYAERAGSAAYFLDEYRSWLSIKMGVYRPGVAGATN